MTTEIEIIGTKNPIQLVYSIPTIIPLNPKTTASEIVEITATLNRLVIKSGLKAEFGMRNNNPYIRIYEDVKE